MSKFSKLFVFLLSFALISCNQENESSIYSSKSDNTSYQASITSSSTKTTSSKENSSSLSSSSSSSSSSSDDKTSEDSKKWGKDITKLMREYLDDQIIPYVDLGGSIYGEFVTTSTFGNIQITSDEEMANDLFSNAETIYRSRGWSIELTTSLFVAKKSRLEINIYKDYQNFNAVLDIFYDEPYDENNTITNWSNDITDTFDNQTDSHYVPYIYLGSKHPFASKFYLNDNYFIIHGGKFDSRVLDEAKIVFSNNSWTYTEGRDVEGRYVEGSYTFNDGDVIKAYVGNYSLTKNKAYIKVTCIEAFNPEGMTSWPSSIISAFDTYLDSHYLPYFYLGTKKIQYNYSSVNNRLTLTGGVYDSRVFDYATSALENDYTIESSINNYGRLLNIYKEYSDGCELYAYLGLNGSGNITLSFKYLKGLNVPVSSTSYPDDILQQINFYTLGHTLPYVYLGKDDIEIEFNNTKTTKSFSLIGDEYNPHMALNAKKTYENAGYTVTLIDDPYGYDFSASKVFDDECLFKVTMLARDSSNKRNEYRAILDVEIDEKYNAHKGSSYPNYVFSTCFSIFSTTFPYVYLGTSLPYINSSTTDKTVTLTGLNYSSNMIDDFEEAFTNDSKDWTIEKKSTSITAIYKNTNSSYIEASLTQENSLPILTFQYYEPFSFDDTLTWSQSLENRFKAILDDYVPPYIYLGTTSPSYYTSYSNVNTIIIKGGVFNSQVLSLAKTTLDNDSWTTSYSQNLYDDTLIATKTAGNDTYRLEISKDSNKTLAKTQLKISLDKDVTISSSSYSTEIETMMKLHLNNHVIPYLDFGVTPTSYYSDNGYLALNYRGYLKNKYISKAKETLENNSWTILENDVYNKNNAIYPFSTLKAKYVDPVDNSIMYLTFLPTYAINSSSSYQIYISYYEAFDDTSSSSYSSEIKKVMKDNFNNEIPYIYLGCSSPSYSYSNNKLTLKGSTWDDSIFNNAKTALLSDTNISWNVNFDSSSDTLIASGESIQTKDKFTLKIYESIDESHGLFSPIMEITHYDAFNPDIESDWSSEVYDAFDAILDGFYLPYFYLGSDNLTLNLSYSKINSYIKLTGKTWDDEIYTLVENSLNSSSNYTYNIYYDYSSSFGKTLIAATTYNNKTITIKVYPDTSNKIPTCYIYYK